MKTYSIETHEMYICHYLVDANDSEEALAKFQDGEADEYPEPEFHHIEGIVSVKEVNDDEDSD